MVDHSLLVKGYAQTEVCLFNDITARCSVGSVTLPTSANRCFFSEPQKPLKYINLLYFFNMSFVGWPLYTLTKSFLNNVTTTLFLRMVCCRKVPGLSSWPIQVRRNSICILIADPTVGNESSQSLAYTSDKGRFLNWQQQPVVEVKLYSFQRWSNYHHYNTDHAINIIMMRVLRLAGAHFTHIPECQVVALADFDPLTIFWGLILMP
jgi:hypothetical protein